MLLSFPEESDINEVVAGVLLFKCLHLDNIDCIGFYLTRCNLAALELDAAHIKEVHQEFVGIMLLRWAKLLIDHLGHRQGVNGFRILLMPHLENDFAPCMTKRKLIVYAYVLNYLHLLLFYFFQFEVNLVC